MSPRAARTGRGPAGADRGSMTVEVAFLLVLLVVPLFYLVGTLGRVQAGAYAASAAAREAGRAYVTGQDPGTAQQRAQAAAALVLQAHGFGVEDATLDISCVGDCLAAGSQVLVATTVQVPLPLVPDFMRGRLPTSVSLSAQDLSAVDEFRAGG